MRPQDQARRREKIRDYIDANRKSPLAGFLYALLFGPLGCIYTDPKSTVIGLLMAVAVALIHWPLVALVWLGCVAVAPGRVRAYNERVRRSAPYLVL